MEPGRKECHDPALADKGLRYVACISFPRSGHGVTERVLKEYFQDRFAYCEFYTPAAEACCKSFPCSRAGITMSKNHDSALRSAAHSEVLPAAGVPYLVLYRSFLEAAVSDYERWSRMNPDRPDSAAEWRRYSRRMLSYYRRFVKKWVLSQNRAERLLIRYEDLTGDPVSTCAKVIEFFHPREPLDRARLQRIVDGAKAFYGTAAGIQVRSDTGVRNRRSLEEFRYFDRAEFASLERQLFREFSRLGYPVRYALGEASGFRRIVRWPGFSWFSPEK